MSAPTHMKETNADLIIDRWSFVGILVGCVVYGLHIALAIACIRAIRRSTAFAGYPRRAHVAIAYVALLFTVATLNMGFKTAEWVYLFVDQRMAPSGPAQTGIKYLGWTNTASNICLLLSLGWVTDLVLIWRAWVLWNKSVPWILLPCALLYLANAALSIVAIYGNGWAHNDAFPTLKVTVVYNWMWLGTNIVLNALVVVRLLWMSRRAKQFVGSKTSNQYISIAVLVMESGFPLTAVQMLYSALDSTHPAACTAVYPLLMQFVAISPELILWRVTKSRSYSGDGSSRGQVTPAPLKALRGKHVGSDVSTLVFKNSTRPEQSSDTGLETPRSLVIAGDMQERAGERDGLRRTRSGTVPVVLGSGYPHDVQSRDGDLDRDVSTESAGRLV